VNWSAAEVAEVPIEFVTVTSTTPADPAGAVAVMDVELTTVTPVALVAPNFTDAPVVVKLVPLIVTTVPPVVGPELGDTPTTVGTAVAEYVNWSFTDVAEVPPAVVTVRSTVPVPDGETAVIEVAELTTKLAAAVPPNLTADVPDRFVPVIATCVPPPVGPALGLTAVTVGAAT
jgi:hypothetical protein